MTTATPAMRDSSAPSRLQRILLRQETILFIILVAGVLLLSLQSDKFLTVDNLLNQGSLATEVALIALPMTLIIITGGIDLSVGSIMGVAAIILGVAWQDWGLPLELAILVRFIVAALVFLDISPFWVKAILGVLILVTVLADVVRRRRQERQ
jgi:rhamnose transport system permease protein